MCLRTSGLGLDWMTLDLGQEAPHVCRLHSFLTVALARARFLELQWLTYSLCSADIGELALRSEQQLEEH